MDSLTVMSLQGPYVYALYSSYGFNKREIGYLFIMGYAASAILGGFVGSIADTYGRKKCCVAYGVIYSISCITKHSSSFSILMFGRLLGGIATSLLHSVFESWMISTHNTEVTHSHQHRTSNECQHNGGLLLPTDSEIFSDDSSIFQFIGIFYNRLFWVAGIL